MGGRLDPRAIARSSPKHQFGLAEALAAACAARRSSQVSAARWTERISMKTIAISATHLRPPAQYRFMARLPDFVALMKPRVMALAVFTALVGLIIAPGHLDPLLG